mgnify:CR=1 FL=1
MIFVIVHALFRPLDDRKSAKDREREDYLIQRIAKLVEERNRLTTELDRMRLR